MSFYAEPDAGGHTVSTDLGSAGLELVRRWGQDLGREVARVVGAMRPVRVEAPLTMTRLDVACPAKDGGPAVPIRLTRLRVGQLDLVGVSGEVATLIDRHLRAAVDRPALVTMTLAGEYAGYLPDDASFVRGKTFEVEHSRVAAGCAETAIIDNAIILLKR